MSEPALAVEDIHTYYGDSYVLQGVSLEVGAGKLVVVMGRNGVGKSTTIRSIVGLAPARRGSVRYEGREITRLDTYRIARLGIGLVPQGRRVFESLSVDEHLQAAAPRRNGSASWTIERIYELFPRLRERRSNKGIQLSGGEQSMLSIARALRTEPKFLLMDEPTEGLAPVYVENVLTTVKQLQESGQSILLVVQELEVALEIADYIYVMNGGRVVFEGEPADLARRLDVQARYLGIGDVTD
jgi:branched-chain amino acid transport system ATP-binding protein